MSELPENERRNNRSDPSPEVESGSAISDNLEVVDEKLSRREVFKKRRVSRKREKGRNKIKNKGRPRMDPHIGLEMFTKTVTPALTRWATIAGVDISDQIIREVEGLSALLIIMTGANDYSTMTAGLFLYIREKFPKSISSHIVSYVQDVLDDTDLSPQVGEEDSKKNNETKDTSEIVKNSWVEFIREIRDNWELCKGNRLFGQFSKIFGLLVTFGLCNADNVTFDIKGYKFIEPDLKVIHGNAQDIITAVCDTVVFFVETCYTAWKTKSFTPFLLGNSDASRLDMEYHELVRFWELARNGNLLKQHGVTDANFSSRLESMATKLKRLLPTLKGLDKQIIEKKFASILSIINDHAISKMAAGYRRAPFAIEFCGPSSQGKTFCAEQITAALFASAGIDNSKGKKFMFDSSKKHWDGARSDMNHFIINDHANVKPEFAENSPCDTIQKICDNAPCVAPMADLARKEKTWMEPELVTVTTNVKDLAARLYSACPFSIQRRMHIVLEVVAKKEFRKKGDGATSSLDSNKVLEKYTIDGKYVAPPFDDVWELEASIAVAPENLAVSAKYKVVEWRGQRLSGVSMEVIVNYCIEMFHIHREQQFKLIELQQSRSKKIELCGVNGCKQLKGHCMEHTCPEAKEPITFDVRQCQHVKFDYGDKNDDVPEKIDSDSESSSNSDSLSFSDDSLTSSYKLGLEQVMEIEKDEFERYGPHGATEKQESQFGDRFFSTFGKAGDMVKNRILGDVGSVSQGTEAVLCAGLLTTARIFVRRFDWVQLVPTDWLYNKTLSKFMMLCDAKRLRNTYVRRSIFQWSLFALGAGMLQYHNRFPFFRREINGAFIGSAFSLCALRQAYLLYDDERKFSANFVQKSVVQWSLLGIGSGLFHFHNRFPHCRQEINGTLTGTALALCLFRQSYMLQSVKDSYIEDLKNRNSITPMIKTLRDQHMETVVKASAIVGAAYTLAKLYKRWRSIDPQGSLEPTTKEEVKARDAEEDVWTEVAKRPLPVTSKSLLSCKEHLEKVVLKNLVYGSVNTGKKILMVNGLFIASNLVMVPNHYFQENEDLEVVFRKENPEACGGKFTTRLHVKSSVLIPGTDMRVCYSPSGGSFKSLVDYFPKDHYPEHNFVMVYRKKDGTILRYEGAARPKKVATVCTFRGGVYDKLSGNTFAGLCGAVLISRGSGGVITGLHLGGRADTPTGCYGSFTNAEITKAIGEVSKFEGVLFTGTAEKFEPQVLGMNVLSNEKIHKKNPLNFMPADSQIEYYGSCPGKVKSVSRVKVTPISHIVGEVCGVPNKWGPPKMKPDWFAWQKCLANLSNPGVSFPHDLFERAVVDYKKPLVPIFKNDLWNDTKPLSDYENINGIPGCKFIDAIKIGTSIGFPLTGPKSEYMTDVDVFDGDGLLNRKFKPEIMAEIARCEDCYKKGERAYCVAKACKKDEVLDQEKCRIFYGNSIALTFLVRKYFLPVARVLMMNPLKSECAVGINSFGPEWQQLMDYLKSKDKEEFLAGDYSKFDQKMAVQILLGSIRINIDFASVCVGYDTTSIKVMRAMAGDIAFACLAFDGNLIGLTCGGHISGNPMTSIFNSICNSLNMRCCFYTIYPEASDFREACALITYGDDNAGSVDPKFKNFNIKSCSEVLGRYGQTYTMPDKKSDLKPFITLEELEFLKRKSVFHESLGCEIGALVDDSCFKRLHCFVREKNPPISEEEACATNIDASLFDWFAHGKEFYEQRRTEMQEVARRAGLEILCKGLNRTYEERAQEWHDKYDSQLN
jgi:hypothetical protein